MSIVHRSSRNTDFITPAKDGEYCVASHHVIQNPSSWQKPKKKMVCRLLHMPRTPGPNGGLQVTRIRHHRPDSQQPLLSASRQDLVKETIMSPRLFDKYWLMNLGSTWFLSDWRKTGSNLQAHGPTIPQLAGKRIGRLESHSIVVRPCSGHAT